jgi:hypothetical protein
VVSSGFAAPEDIVRFRDCDAVLSKPAAKEDLLSAVRDVLASHSGVLSPGP